MPLPSLLMSFQHSVLPCFLLSKFTVHHGLASKGKVKLLMCPSLPAAGSHSSCTSSCMMSFPGGLAVERGMKLSTVWMWSGCYSIIGTSSLQAWLQGKEKVSASLEVCHFVSLFTGGGLLGSAPWTLSSVAIACPLPSSSKTWLGDMVLKEWQPWL